MVCFVPDCLPHLQKGSQVLISVIIQPLFLIFFKMKDTTFFSILTTSFIYLFLIHFSFVFVFLFHSQW